MSWQDLPFHKAAFLYMEDIGSDFYLPRVIEYFGETRFGDIEHMDKLEAGLDMLPHVDPSTRSRRSTTRSSRQAISPTVCSSPVGISGHDLGNRFFAGAKASKNKALPLAGTPLAGEALNGSAASPQHPDAPEARPRELRQTTR